MKSEYLEDIIESFNGIPIVQKGDYNYFVHPLSDGIPMIDPILLDKGARLMSDLIPEGIDFDILITAEAMGIPLTTTISGLISKPFSIVRKRGYGINGEIKIEQSTGYSEGILYINLAPGKNRCIIVDDVLSTGGTLRSMFEGIRRSGSEPIGAVILFDKMKAAGRESIEKELGVWIRPLLYVDIENGKCRASPTEFVLSDLER
jgi:adenine phosphoribosyltransferase